MIGSDRGWVHAPYVEAPATLDLKPVAAPFDDAHIVPGIAFVDGETCDVMRGEETLLAGLDAPDAVVCLPGTHSKWATLESGRLTRFRTYMTGEIRAAMLASGAFATGVEQAASPGAFAQGLHAAGPVTAALFQARARRLLGKLAPEHTASFVDGVLIGAEIADAPAHAVTLVAAGPIAGQYKSALAGRIGAVVDPEPLAARGLLRIARRAGLV
jgi:2-dehydro-3-deoxygalactonokinase